MMIWIGYERTIRVNAEASDPPPFPAGSEFRVQVRSHTGVLFATLTTGSGITRNSDTQIDITIPESATAQMTEGSVILDVVRTDTTPDYHLGFQLLCKTRMPATRAA